MRAIISVSDKTDVAVLGRGLAAMGAEIYSTGGTQQALEAAGIAVRPVSDLTGFPEILEGRVKTLHPAVYGGLLARREVPADLEELARHGLAPIDLVAINLYPFERTVARRDVALATALAQIDIGGPAMLRAAAKNFSSVLPLCDPRDYPDVLEALRKPDGPGQAFRRGLAAKAFRHVAVYDALIAAYLGAGDPAWPQELPLGLRKVHDLRYGENPQQQAAFYAALEAGAGPSGLVGARQLQGKPLSYNNILDADAAWLAASDFEPAAVAIIKHTNPCGLARASTPLEAYERALAGDPLAAFGGVVAVNEVVNPLLAERIAGRFYEIVLAPGFDAGALERLAARPDLRVLALPFEGVEESHLTWRSVTGGVLVQEADRVGKAEVRRGEVVTRRAPSEEEWAALAFAWRAVRHVKSNAIVLAQGEALVGMGAGQPSRVAAVEIAVERAGVRAEGAVLASDAFFPKADGVEAAIGAGVRAIVQPGGSRGDPEVIAAADAAGMAMVLTGTRHFLH
ncbi:MAG: bifunctional phosphoribosylaminoimidazolecarboxamide formyltransferase/IMP cyclohydrolase [Anaerolineae bacterium]